MNAIKTTTSETEILHLAWTDLTIDPADILRILGYEDENVPAQFGDELEDVLKTAGSYCDIRAGFRLIEEIALDDAGHLCIQDMECDIGKTISHQLRGADSIALFACTIGEGLETWSRDLMANSDFLKGYIVDAVASVAIEKATEELHDRLAEITGKKTTNRYSPGYCGWDVAEQQKLFSLLPPNFCGITLSPSSLMMPIKSVSGLIGLGKSVTKVDYTCQFCNMKDCVYRRRKRTLRD